MAKTSRSNPLPLMKIFYGLTPAGFLIFITVALVGNPARASMAELTSVARMRKVQVPQKGG